MKLKLSSFQDDTRVKITTELPSSLHRDLVAYAEALAKSTGGPPVDPTKLIVPMLERFMSTDRAFAKAKRQLVDRSRA